MGRTIAIGDIHGALRALEQLINKIKVQKDDKLIFLGDYVDGWSESAQVIEYLTQLEKDFDCLFIKGNHDVWCERWLKGESADKDWLFHGGKLTIESYATFTQEKKRTHLKFFERLRNYYIDDNNRLFIHAGFSSMHGPQHEHYETNCYWDRSLWEMAIAMEKNISEASEFYPKRLKLFHEIIIGHTPTVNYQSTTPIHAANLWNIDTGAAFMGKLTAMDTDSKEIWQSDIVQHLYPNEKGRNK